MAVVALPLAVKRKALTAPISIGREGGRRKATQRCAINSAPTKPAGARVVLDDILQRADAASLAARDALRKLLGSQLR